MDQTETPQWMKQLELLIGVLSVLCVLAVLMVVVLHLGWRSGCTRLDIC